MDPEASQDMDNSIDQETEKLQLLMQGRIDFQKREVNQRRFMRYKDQLPEQERELYGLNQGINRRNMDYQRNRRERRDRQQGFRSRFNRDMLGSQQRFDARRRDFGR